MREKFYYLQILPLLLLRSNSVTCKFYPCYCYGQIPLLANSTPATVTVKFHYLQTPPLLLLRLNSITCKFHVIQLPLCSSTFKFHRITFTVKFHFLQIQPPPSYVASLKSLYVISTLTTFAEASVNDCTNDRHCQRTHAVYVSA